MFQDSSSIVDHIIDDLPGGKNLMYLSGDATGQPWPGTERIFGVLLEIVFDGNDTLFEKSFGFGLTVVLPDSERRSMLWIGLLLLPHTTGECFQLTNRQCKDS